MRYVILQKNFISNTEKIHKILIEIKREEDEKNKFKKTKDTKELYKLLEKIKKICRTCPMYLDTEKIFFLLKNLNDLILTFQKDIE